VCTGCHTSRNHKPGGKLFGLKPVTRTLKDAAYMNIVRWQMMNALREEFPEIEIFHTYGSYTKAYRRELGQLAKTHANDAYAMGEFHPKHRHQEEHFKKRRRSNRVLSKFYDAKYLDVRDHTIKKEIRLAVTGQREMCQGRIPTVKGCTEDIRFLKAECLSESRGMIYSLEIQFCIRVKGICQKDATAMEAASCLITGNQYLSNKSELFALQADG
jgi:hypothetical protein